MVHIKRQWIAVAFSALVQLCLMSHTYATEPFPYTDNNYISNPTTNVGQVLKQGSQGGSLLENLLTLFGINYADPTHKGKAIIYVQVIINYVLALLGAIAVIMILYSFFMIFFGKDDDGVAKARKTIIGAAIALLVIGLSAYIVNYIFYIYNKGI